jgi:hypothetical protein
MMDGVFIFNVLHLHGDEHGLFFIGYKCRCGSCCRAFPGCIPGGNKVLVELQCNWLQLVRIGEEKSNYFAICSVAGTQLGHLCIESHWIWGAYSTVGRLAPESFRASERTQQAAMATKRLARA